MKTHLPKVRRLLWLRWLVMLSLFLGLGNLDAWAVQYKYQVLHEWDSDSVSPTYNLVRDAQGNFYGYTSTPLYGNPPTFGHIFKISPEGNYSVIHQFDKTTGGLQSGLTVGNDGSLYGTTIAVSIPKTISGTVFKIDASGTFTVVHTFAKDDISGSPNGVTLAPDGTLYGVTVGTLSGPNLEASQPGAYGTVYKISPDGTYNVIHNFDYVNGFGPNARVTISKDGSLYGTTYGSPNRYGCGISSCPYGTIYKLDTNGTFKVLHFFDGTLGKSPNAQFVLANDGNLYANSDQTKSDKYYALKIDSNDNVSAVLDYNSIGLSIHDPYVGLASLSVDSNGNLIGQGFDALNNKEYLFNIESTGTTKQLFSFDTTDVSKRVGIVAFENGGNYYSVNAFNGKNNTGAIWKIDSTGVTSAFYEFASPGNNHPGGKVIIANDGSLYGLNQSVSNKDGGSIFKIATNGTYSEPFVFDSAQKGFNPDSLIMDKDGSFYGTTQNGGEFNEGIVFKLSPNGQETILYTFKETDYFHSGLSLGSDGNLYGLIEKNSSYVKYKLTKEGIYTELNSYSDVVLVDPVMGVDGSFYGVGQNNLGSFIYKISPQDDLQTLYTFDNISDIHIAIAKDGNLYGTSGASGSNQVGSFFKLDTNGVYTVLYNFKRPFNAASPSPFNNVELGEDGSIYSGSYRLSPSGQLSVFPNFPASESYTTITLGNDGSLYGTVPYGGKNGTGLVIKYSPISNVRLPKATTDIATTAQTQSVTVNVIANDKAFNGKTIDPASVMIIAEPANGTVAVNADGSVTYTPSSGYGGKDTFTYSVKDSAGAVSNDARVVVTVPKVVDDNYTVNANGNATQSQTLAWRKGVMANDLPSGLSGKSFALTSNPVRVSGEEDDSKLTITAFNPANGYLNFQLTGKGKTIAERQEAKVGVFEFSYTMTLNGITTAPAKVTITVVKPQKTAS